MKKNLEKESPLRRLEVTFFIALPFAFLISFITLHSFDVVKDSIEKKQLDFNANVWKEYKIALLASTLCIASAVSLREAWIIWKVNSHESQAGEDNGNKEVSLNISALKRF